MKRSWRHILGLAGLILSVACGPGDRRGRYPARGVVLDVDGELSQVLIDHEDVPGLMPAMTMNFEVPDPELLASLVPGQAIDFTLEFTGRSYRVTAFSPLGDAAPVSAGPRFSGVADLFAPAPDFELVDQEGEIVRLADLRGKLVVLDFVYTRCPGPCPILTASHVALQRRLPPSLREQTWFVSISLDPETDTPAALRDYATARGADLSDWSFLTGSAATVAAVTRSYGVGSPPRLPDGSIEHVVVTYLIDVDGVVARRYVGLEHDADELLRDLERLASSAASGAASG